MHIDRRKNCVGDVMHIGKTRSCNSGSDNVMSLAGRYIILLTTIAVA